MSRQSKNFFLDPNAIKPIAMGFGSCFATDRVTVDGALVGYMYREEPDNELDSGWRFFAGDETDEYVNEPANSGLYDVNTVANIDAAITPFLEAPARSAFAREGQTFVADIFPPQAEEDQVS